MRAVSIYATAVVTGAMLAPWLDISSCTERRRR
jgi:hypothetical protein